MTVGAYGLTPLHLAVVCLEDTGECATLLTREVPAVVAFFSAKADDGHTPADYAAEVPQRHRFVACKLHDRLVRPALCASQSALCACGVGLHQLQHRSSALSRGRFLGGGGQTCAISTVLTLLEENEACGVLWCTMSCDLARQQLREEAEASEELEEATLLAVSMVNTLAEDYSTYGVAELPARYAQFFHDSTSDFGSGFTSPADLVADTYDVSPGALWRALCDSARVHQPDSKMWRTTPELARTAPVACLTQVSNHSARVRQPDSKMWRTTPELARTAPVARLTQVPPSIAPVVPNHASDTSTSSANLPLSDTARSQKQHSQPSSKSSRVPIWDSARDSARDDPPSTTNINCTAPVEGVQRKTSLTDFFSSGTIPPANQNTVYKKTTSRRKTFVASCSTPNRRSMKRYVLNVFQGLWRKDKNIHASCAAPKEAAVPLAELHVHRPQCPDPHLLRRTHHGNPPA